MSLLPCRRCGRTDPRRMVGLMTLWFGRFLELPQQGGYFYLCPACYGELVAPHIQDIRRQVLEFHPHLRKHLDEVARREAEGRDGSAAAGSPPGNGTPPAGGAPSGSDGPEAPADASPSSS